MKRLFMRQIHMILTKTALRIRITLILIWILLLIEEMRICDSWPTKPPRLNFDSHCHIVTVSHHGSPWLHFEPP
jgi:hypothetical protein